LEEAETTKGAEMTETMQRLSELANQVEDSAWVVTVIKVGQNTDGLYIVSLGMASGGVSYTTYSWPEWAYELAKSALLHNKKLEVVSTGGSPVHGDLIQLGILM
jgi:hypothetical protein